MAGVEVAGYLVELLRRLKEIVAKLIRVQLILKTLQHLGELQELLRERDLLR